MNKSANFFGAEAFVVRRNVAPAKHATATREYTTLDLVFRRATSRVAGRKKQHADAVFTGVGQRDASATTGIAEQRMRNLKEESRAVGRLAVGAGGASMRQVGEQLECRVDDGAGSLAAQVGDEPDSARVVLERRIVEPLRGR